MNTKLRCLVVGITFLLCAVDFRVQAFAADVRPNIVVFMVDDLGWNHIGTALSTMGTNREQYRTPHIDRLAKAGLSFTHAYAQPNCAPTRAAMLSGQYPSRIHNDVYVVGNLNRYGLRGITWAKARFRGPQQTEDVAAEAITLAETLQRNGYATAHIGKYHVGGHSGQQTMPENAGFEINIGGYKQGHQPVCFASQQDGKWKFRGLGLGHFDRFAQPYSREYLARRGLPAELADTPKHVSDAIGDAAEETIRTLAEAEKPFYLQLHTYAVHGPVRARPDLKKRARSYADRKLEYVGFIAGVDENVGRLIKNLKDPNGDGDQADSILNKTLVLFTSDNGGTHADNLPLKGKKGMFTEGGIRVPLIAYWPGVVPEGAVSDRIIHAVDYYPTLLELAGNRWTPPQDQHPLDGESFASALRKPAESARQEPVYYLFPGYLDERAQPCAVALGDHAGKRYKLIYSYEPDAWELYRLTDDQAESTNLIKAEPRVAAELSAKLQAWLAQDHPTWHPKYPIDRQTGESAGPPPKL